MRIIRGRERARENELVHQLIDYDFAFLSERMKIEEIG
jgi:hypothetical protein